MALSENLLSQGSGLFGTVTSAYSLGDTSHFGYASSAFQGLVLREADWMENSHTQGGSMLATSHPVTKLVPENHVTKLMLPPAAQPPTCRSSNGLMARLKAAGNDSCTCVWTLCCA